MTAIELLTKDHRKVDALFEQIESNKGYAEEIFSQIHHELSLHAQIEEQLFYPELELSSKTADKVQHSYQEHREVKNLLSELASGNPDDAAWMSKLRQLKENVQHHVKEEEGELFPKAKDVLGEGRLEEIGLRIEQMKKQNKGPEFRAA